MSKPKENQVWAFWANKFGPWHNTPQKVDKEGWHRSGDAHVERLGLVQRRGYVCYSSKDKMEVKRFIDGFNSCRDLLSDFFEK